MRKMATTALAVLLVFGAAACGSDDGDSQASDTTEASDTTTAKILTFKDPATPIAVVRGQDFAISVPTTAGTGYVWTVTGAPDPAVAVVTDPEGNVEAAPNGGAVGTTGSTIFEMKAVASGTTTVTFTSARPTAPEDNPTVTTFTINVS